MACLYDLARIQINRRCGGYYLRWWYNGWHYWLFTTGYIFFETEGEKYRTLGRQKLRIGSTQLTEEQTTAIRTIMNTREIYIYTDSGWGAVRVEPGSWEVFNNLTHGYDVEITIIIGSRAVSSTGFSPAIQVPAIPPSYAFCETLVIGTQVWMCLNYDQAIAGSRVYENDEGVRASFGGLYTHAQVMSPGFCPPGWHVPTIAEWLELINYVGDLTDAGKLKRDGTSYWNAPNTGANNEESFDMRSTGIYGFVLGPGTGYHYLYEVAMLWAQDGFVRFDYNLGSVSVNYFTLPDYYYGVRLIKDGCFLNPVVATAATNEGDTDFDANWNVCAGATGYFLDVSTDPAFGSFVPGYNNLSVGNVLTYNVTGLTPGVTYYYRLRAEGGGCSPSTSSNVISIDTLGSFIVTSRGAGTGVATLTMRTTADVVLTLDGTARFYSDAAGTLNESTTWTCVAGAQRQRYVRCPSGTANLSYSDHSAIIWFGYPTGIGSTSGQVWAGATGIIASDTPSLTIYNLTDANFPNVEYLAAVYNTITICSWAVNDIPKAMIRFYNSVGTMTGTLSDLPPNLEMAYINAPNTISGNTSDIPASLVEFNFGGLNTITGDIADIPANSIYVWVAGNNTITGDIADVPATVTTLGVLGSNTLSGDVVNLPANLTLLQISGANTITGDIADMPNTLVSIMLIGNNTLSGDLVDIPTACLALTVSGANTLTGGFTGLNASMVSLQIQGSNTVNGDLADLPVTLAIIVIAGNNTVIGSISDIPAPVYYFNVTGSNTIDGDIGDLADSTCYVFLLTGNNTVSGYSGRTWNATQTQFVLVPTGGGLDATEVDNLLIDVDSDCAFTGTHKSVTLTGTNAAPTAASLAARNSLIAKGVTVTTN